jgi:hypothetical protein
VVSAQGPPALAASIVTKTTVETKGTWFMMDR